MPRPGPRRPLVSFKLDQSAIDWIDRLASERGENRSETMRAMLAFAQQADAARLATPAGQTCGGCDSAR
jgi:Arc/MetJ-type ribon-helix-helix transcriptional regulator